MRQNCAHQLYCVSVISNFFPGLRFAFTGPLTFPREKPELQLVKRIPIGVSKRSTRERQD
jgi:hypothetical protein